MNIPSNQLQQQIQSKNIQNVKLKKLHFIPFFETKKPLKTIKIIPKTIETEGKLSPKISPKIIEKQYYYMK